MQSVKSDYTIYIIGENSEELLMIHHQLQLHYVVVQKNYSGSLVALINLNQPDLIITDLDAEAKQVKEFVSNIKNHATTNHIPVLALSIDNSVQNHMYAINLGAEVFLSKPVHLQLLIAFITQIKRQRKILQNKFQEGEGHTRVNPNVKSSGISRNFMQNVLLYIYENLNNQELNVEEMASHFLLSRTQFYRKVKAQSGVAPNVFIRKVRLEKAKIMLETSDLNISEVVYEVGFTSSSYFAKCFKREFGYLPYEVKNQKNTSAATSNFS